MKSFQWGSNYLTGILSVDEQHKELVNIINNIGDSISQEDVALHEIDAALNALIAYSEYHFTEEQEMMFQARIYEQHLDNHIKSHKSFLNEVTRLSSEASNDNPAAMEHLLDFLLHWLAYHILGTDKNMAKQIELIKSGMSAEQAFIQEELEADNSTEPLITALNGLFSQVSQRNKELALLNRTLEDKVEERTKALLEANNNLEQIALTDVLTGLPNRRHAMQQLSLLWDESARNTSPLSCLMIDADYFKQVNDSYGHDVGDNVLQELSRALTGSVRTDDLACRLGGDEFLIILPSTDLEGALLAANITHESVSKLRVKTGDSAWKGSVSIGVSARTDEMRNINDLIKTADKGVYFAKENGKNCVKTIQ
jgi:diguanylate cyclase (GGDEF)-like protein/hemerythrin-like metal-binding protein